MNYVIESKHNDVSLKAVKELKLELDKLGFKENVDKPEYVFSLGGDGTLLKAINKYKNLNPVFVGVNLGNLGFLCSFKKSNIQNSFNIENNKIIEIPLLEINVNGVKNYALNEVRVESMYGKCSDMKIYIDNELFSNIKADGICVSSNIGSTGINKSLGGSVVDLNVPCLQLIEKLPVINRKYNAFNSGLILDVNKTIEVELPYNNMFLVAYDSYFFKSKAVDKIKIKMSNKKIRLLVNKEFSHLDKIKEAFL